MKKHPFCCLFCWHTFYNTIALDLIKLWNSLTGISANKNKWQCSDIIVNVMLQANLSLNRMLNNWGIITPQCLAYFKRNWNMNDRLFSSLNKTIVWCLFCLHIFFQRTPDVRTIRTMKKIEWCPLDTSGCLKIVLTSVPSMLHASHSSMSL